MGMLAEGRLGVNSGGTVGNGRKLGSIRKQSQNDSSTSLITQVNVAAVDRYISCELSEQPIDQVSSAVRGVSCDVDRKAFEGGERIAIVESRIFLRECIRRGMQAALPLPIDTYASIADLKQDSRIDSTRLVIVSWSTQDQGSRDEYASSIFDLSQLIPGVRIVVLAFQQNPELARAAIRVGAKGYIPISTGFDVAVEVVRFVLAGGTYVPAEYLLAETAVSHVTLGATDFGAVTAREALVVRAIQQGKPNKIIAYELNMCESTVKVHVRHIMKKLGAKNRTAVAMKANEITLVARAAPEQTGCGAAGSGES
jgi:DNA-binding NarL/FixJ family response regulator